MNPVTLKIRQHEKAKDVMSIGDDIIIEIDGKEFTNIKSIEFKTAVGEGTRAFIEMFVNPDIEIETMVAIKGILDES